MTDETTTIPTVYDLRPEAHETKTPAEYEAELATLREQAQETAEKAREAYSDELDDNVADFDAFCSEHTRKRNRKRVKVYGQIITLPKSIPLLFELEARRLATSTKDQDVQRLVAILFGADAYERWAEAGMDADEFQVLLAWAPRHIAGLPDTLEQVAAELAEAEANQVAADPS